MRYFTTGQIRASLLLCVLAVAGWGIRYHQATKNADQPFPFEPWPGDKAAAARADSIRHYLSLPVEVNIAGTLELQRLDGIGPELAGRIIDERNRGGNFTDLENLAIRVRGIGPATAADLSGKISFRPSRQNGNRK